MEAGLLILISSDDLSLLGREGCKSVMTCPYISLSTALTDLVAYHPRRQESSVQLQTLLVQLLRDDGCDMGNLSSYMSHELMPTNAGVYLVVVVLNFVLYALFSYPPVFAIPFHSNLPTAGLRKWLMGSASSACRDSP